jgi:murein DD-endopeptidase MepM/ murein hydrolase activator NlpD
MWLMRLLLIAVVLVVPAGGVGQAATSLPPLQGTPLEALLPPPDADFPESSWKMALELLWEDGWVEQDRELGPQTAAASVALALALEPEFERGEAFARWIAGATLYDRAVERASARADHTGQATWPIEELPPRTRRAVLEAWQLASRYAERLTLQRPIGHACRTSSRFGPRLHPIRRVPLLHKGVDLAVPVGTEVLSAQSGVVVAVGESRSSGRYVIVDHGDDIRTSYLHLDSAKVRRGDQVARGELLGLSGKTGRVTGPHLHFELWVRGVPLDPAPLMESPARS